MSNELSPIQKELLDRADTIFKTIAEAATKAANFAAEQLPDIAYQYIAMERVVLTSAVLFSVICFCMSFYLFVWGICKDKWKMGNDAAVILFPVAGFGAMGLIMFINTFKNFVMVWFAPKIYLITNIIHLIKS